MKNKIKLYKTSKIILFWITGVLVFWDNTNFIKNGLCNGQLFIFGSLFDFKTCEPWLNAITLSSIFTTIGHLAEKYHERAHDKAIKHELDEKIKAHEERFGGWWLYGLVDFQAPDKQGKENIFGFFNMQHKDEDGDGDIEKRLYHSHAFQYQKEDNTSIPEVTLKGTWCSLFVFERPEIDNVIEVYYEMARQNIIQAETTYYRGIISIGPCLRNFLIKDNPVGWNNIYCGVVRPTSVKHDHHGYIFCVRVDSAEILRNEKNIEQVKIIMSSLAEERAPLLIKRANQFKNEAERL